MKNNANGIDGEMIIMMVILSAVKSTNVVLISSDF